MPEPGQTSDALAPGEHELQYRAIFEATSDGLVINDLASGRVLEVNPAFCEMHGFSRDELIGAHPSVFIHPSSQALFPRYVELVRAGQEFRASARDVRKDGSTLEVEVVGRAFVFQGRPAVLGVVRDVTEQVRARELLEQRVEERTRELSTLYGADEALYRSLRVQDVLESLVDVATRILGADKAGVMVWDERHERLVPRIGRGFSPEFMASVAFVPGQGVAGRVAQTGQLETVPDLLADPRVDRAQIVAAGVRSIIYAPIVVHGEVFGIFSVDWLRPRAFDQGEPRVMQALAQRAALAVENARLYEQAQHAAALEERQRLARELHDSVSQALYGIALGAQTALGALEDDHDAQAAVQPLRYVLGLASAGLAEMRALIFELRPESLEQEGLVVALRKQAAALRARHGLDVVEDFGPEPDLPLARKEAIYRVAQEALHNVVKHARAGRVELRLARRPDGPVRLEVTDDGRGFDPAQPFPGHLGLRSMRERVARTGGTLRIESPAGGGTRLVAEVPTAA